MKKLILIGLLTLAVSTGVGTAARLVVAPPHPAKPAAPALPETSTGSAAKPAAVVKGGAADHAPAGAGSLATSAGSATPSPVSDTSGIVPAASSPPIVAASPAARPATGPVIELKELGQIVRQMPPAQASLLLEKLNDDQVLGIVRGMTVMDAVALLNALPSTRAATLRDRLLTDTGKR